MTAGTAGGAWSDLSDVEIVNRLHQRGLGLELCRRLLRAARAGDTAAILSVTKKLEV